MSSHPEPAALAGAAGDPRTAQIAANLSAVRARIAAACTAVGRDPAEITLVAVTKTFPAEDVQRLVQLGVLDIGENREQEARAKVAVLAAAGVAARWHFVGRLQRKKCRSVVRYASMVHSVDRAQLVAALDAAVAAADRTPLDVLIQVSLDGDPGRGGAVAAAVPTLAEAVEAAGGLRLAGVMTVAPLGADPDQAFAELASVSAALRRDHPQARLISAGMSGDLDQAIKHGATHVRVGTALLGGRAVPVG